MQGMIQGDSRGLCPAVAALLELASQGVLVNYLSRMTLMTRAPLLLMMLMSLILRGGGSSSLFFLQSLHSLALLLFFFATHGFELWFNAVICVCQAQY